MPVPTINTIRPRRRRKRRDTPTSSDGPPASLTLLAASFDPGELTIDLAFSYAIDLANYNGEQVVLNDPVHTGVSWLAVQNPTQTGSASVRIGLIEFEVAAPGSTVTLGAPSWCGIKVFGGTGSWAGCSDLVLPFGA